VVDTSAKWATEHPVSFGVATAATVAGGRGAMLGAAGALDNAAAKALVTGTRAGAALTKGGEMLRGAAALPTLGKAAAVAGSVAKSGIVAAVGAARAIVKPVTVAAAQRAAVALRDQAGMTAIGRPRPSVGAATESVTVSNVGPHLPPSKIDESPVGINVARDAAKRAVDEGIAGTHGDGPTVANSAIEKVNGRFPINAKYAGRDFPLAPKLAAKYPAGIKFNHRGYPDFSRYVVRTATPPGLYKGSRELDYELANKEVGLTETPKGHTWHHKEDGVTMELVPRDLHRAVCHTGGVAMFGH